MRKGRIQPKTPDWAVNVAENCVRFTTTSIKALCAIGSAVLGVAAVEKGKHGKTDHHRLNPA